MRARVIIDDDDEDFVPMDASGTSSSGEGGSMRSSSVLDSDSASVSVSTPASPAEDEGEGEEPMSKRARTGNSGFPEGYFSSQKPSGYYCGKDPYVEIDVRPSGPSSQAATRWPVVEVMVTPRGSRSAASASRTIFGEQLIGRRQSKLTSFFGGRPMAKKARE